MVNYIFFILFTYLCAGRQAGRVRADCVLAAYASDLQHPVFITPDRLSIKPMDTLADNTIAD
jgi:hypothetical protein